MRNIKFRVVMWDACGDEFDGYGYHRTKRLAKKHARQLALAYPGRSVDVLQYMEDGDVSMCWTVPSTVTVDQVLAALKGIAAQHGYPKTLDA